ncbi:MAG TPA: hypothetical protein VEB69_01155 [Acidimicrobiia bacterium]|nr:hypothetical protein [Acidimicrobiia bacterium]
MSRPQETQKRCLSRLVAVLAILAIVVAACGGDEGGEAPADGGGDATLDHYDFSGVTISVGSKDCSTESSSTSM